MTYLCISIILCNNSIPLVLAGYLQFSILELFNWCQNYFLHVFWYLCNMCLIFLFALMHFISYISIVESVYRRKWLWKHFFCGLHEVFRSFTSVLKVFKMSPESVLLFCLISSDDSCEIYCFNLLINSSINRFFEKAAKSSTFKKLSYRIIINRLIVSAAHFYILCAKILILVSKAVR